MHVTPVHRRRLWGQAFVSSAVRCHERADVVCHTLLFSPLHLLLPLLVVGFELVCAANVTVLPFNVPLLPFTLPVSAALLLGRSFLPDSGAFQVLCIFLWFSCLDALAYRFLHGFLDVLLHVSVLPVIAHLHDSMAAVLNAASNLPLARPPFSAATLPVFPGTVSSSAMLSGEISSQSAKGASACVSSSYADLHSTSHAKLSPKTNASLNFLNSFTTMLTPSTP